MGVSIHSEVGGSVYLQLLRSKAGAFSCGQLVVAESLVVKALEWRGAGQSRLRNVLVSDVMGHSLSSYKRTGNQEMVGRMWIGPLATV